MTDYVKVEGLDKLGETLKQFSSMIALRYLKHSTQAAARLFLEEAKQLTPVLSGALQEAEAVFKRPGADANEVHYVVGIRRIKRKAKVRKLLRLMNRLGYSVGIQDDIFYGRFMEFGFHDKAGVFHKYPFMRPAFENKKEESLEVFRADLERGVAMAVGDVAQ